jgi:hypothetical protein
VRLEQVNDSFVTTVQLICAKKNHPTVGWFFKGKVLFAKRDFLL